MKLFKLVGIFLFLYLIVSLLIFNIRHPWATEIECLMYIKQAVTFQKIPYEEMRPRSLRPADWKTAD